MNDEWKGVLIMERCMNEWIRGMIKRANENLK